MRWTYNLKYKIQSAVVLFVLLALIFVNNFKERGHIKELEESFQEIFDDRLMAETYLFEISLILQEKNRLFQAKQNHFKDNTLSIKQLNDSIEAIIDLYKNTYLTPPEERLFEGLQVKLSELHAAEKQVLVNPDFQNEILRSTGNTEVLIKLHELSRIQTIEGRALLDKSRAIVLKSISTSRFEMTLIIITGLIIQALIFAARVSDPVGKPNLN